MSKDCFVVEPIGAADSSVRIHADWLLEEIISPVLQGYPEFIVHRADNGAEANYSHAQGR